MKDKFNKFISENVLLLDGAMGTQVQALELSDDDFGGSEYKMLSDLLTFSRPDDLKEIHKRYLSAGSNGIETNTFGASPLRLCEYDFTNINTESFVGLPKGFDLKSNDYEKIAYEISLKACRIARSAVEEYQSSSEYDGRALFVFGSIGPSNWVLTSTNANLRRGTYEKIVDNFYHQTLGLIDGGADVLLFETMQDPLETKAAIHGGQKALKERQKELPIIAQVTVDEYSKMQIFNTDILSALTTLQGIGVDVFGINCSIGPDLMRKTVEKLSKFSKVPLSVIPNAGLPVSENGKTVFKFEPKLFGSLLREYVEKYGVRIVGGCCGTSPEYIREVRKQLNGVKLGERVKQKMVYVSGPQEAIPLDSESGLIRIAERLNVRGSKKVRDAVEVAEKTDYDALEEVVNEQVRDLGAPIIDVCMDSNLVDTTKVLNKVIRELTTDFPGAMCIDSFSVEALLEAIKVYPGRPILNSISLEEYAPGVDKIDAVVGPTKHHDPIYIALTTGPKGPGLTAEDKFNLAEEIYNKCTKIHGLRADQLIVDVNAFPIGSESDENMNFAVESLKSISMIKNLHPNIMISMGVGNLTTGLGKKPYMRKILTSVFVDLARKEGLDAAIINPNHYVPVESLDSSDVELALKVIQEHDMDAFATLEDIAEQKKGGAVKKKVIYDELPLEESICQKIKDGFKQKVAGFIEENNFRYEYKDKIVEQIAQAIKVHEPLKFINDYLMAAMKELGDGFGKGEVSLPHLLKSADVMKHAMGYIESKMRFESGAELTDQIEYKGTVVLGTVYQDVHSIGKDLVKTLLENYGYRVIDLGVQTPLEKFVEEAKKYKADAVGMSALLVQTSNHMITVAQMLYEAGLEDTNILIGGAPVNYRHAAYVSLRGQDDPHEMLPNVFYCSSGMDGVNVMNQLMEDGEYKDKMIEENLSKLKWHYENAIKNKEEEQKLLDTLPRRQVDVSKIKRTRNDFISPTKMTFTMKDFLPYIDRKTLYSLNWRYGGQKSWEKKGTSKEKLDQLLEKWVKLCDDNRWLIPQVMYSIRPCYSYGERVILLDPDNIEKEDGEIKFNSCIGADKKDIFSVAQYFLSKESGLYDVIGMQVSTSGMAVEQQIEKFKEDGDTESALILQGLSDRVAEDLAEYTNNLLREKMSLTGNDGCRYSPGYPALKELKGNHILFDELDCEKELGISMTDAHEFDPTGSTGAFVCFHPQARYD